MSPSSGEVSDGGCNVSGGVVAISIISVEVVAAIKDVLDEAEVT